MPDTQGLANLRGVLTALDYGPELIRDEYPVWTGSGTVLADIVAFGVDTPTDMTTATILGGDATGDLALGRIFELARSLAAPVALIARPDHQLEVWSVAREENRTERVVQTSMHLSSAALEPYRRVLAPRVLLAAKRGGSQLALFPIDVSLLSDARQKTSGRLSTRVEQAVAVAAASYAALSSAIQQDQLLFSPLDRAGEAVVTAMAALVARDKLGLRQGNAPEDVLHAAAELFPGYFSWKEWPDHRRDVTLDAISSLGADINFGSLDSAVVSSVYEDALVSEAVQRRLGIYYTPPDLARRVASQIPIEELEPENRILLDAACGSGTLLLAGYDRLREALPEEYSPAREHEYARAHLVGSDADPFAVQLAKLTLLLHSLPAGDGWQVQRRSIEAVETVGDASRPSIVFSNPPWRSVRPQSAAREEMADRFVLKMLDVVAPGGFLALILPASWLTSRQSAETRKIVAERSTVFETWRLPRDTFGRSNLVPCVVFAQAETSSRPTVARWIKPGKDWRHRFLSEGIADESYLSAKSTAPKDWVMGPLHSAERDLSELEKLNSLADVQLGPPPREPVAEVGGTGDFLWLRRAGGVRAYEEIPRGILTRVRFPEDFSKRGQVAGIYLREKVLVSSMSTGDEAWRLKVFLDPWGVIPRQSMHMVVPKQEDRDLLMAFVALLSSSVASAWVGTGSPRLYISPKLLGQLPVPPMDVWKAPLAEAGSRLVAERKCGTVPIETVETVESLVQEAYALSKKTRAALALHFAGARAPDGLVRFASRRRKSQHVNESRHFGAVLDVRNDELRLWVPGFTPEEGTWMAPPPRLPGWLMAPGSTFEVSVRGHLQDGHFKQQSRSFMDLDDLERVLANPDDD